MECVRVRGALEIVNYVFWPWSDDSEQSTLLPLAS